MVVGRIVEVASLATAIASYDESRAIKFGKLAGAAYCPTTELESWSCGDFCRDVPVSSVRVCEGDVTKAYVGMWEGKGLVSFMGTHGVAAFFKDLEFLQSAADWDKCSKCKVHGGFLDEYNSLKSCIKSSLQELGAATGSSIRTTGHSLGAALNSIAMLDLDYSGWHVEESYDFGKPRTGDSNFAAAWNSKFFNIGFRVTHHRDPVPQVPPDQLIFNWHFEHVESEIFYKGGLSSGHQECTAAHQTTCAEEFWNLPLDLLNVDDHLNYLDLPIASCPGGGFADAVV